VALFPNIRWDNQANIMELLTKARILLASRERVEKTIAELSEHWSVSELLLRLRENDKRPSQDGAPYVGTVHSAKGCEWDTVYLPAFEEGVLPLSSESPERERNLAYVAVTRARRRVVISHAASRTSTWGKSNQKPSRFIKEMNL
jgi:DNA helicase-2/ATP-dependent DNA helicase PcrA